MNEIGGYFEINFKEGSHFHSGERLNLGRNALLYLVIANNIKKLYVPGYICDSALSKLVNNNIELEFYSVNKQLMPTTHIAIEKNEALLYVNYFGVCEENCKKILSDFGTVIIDNSQAFFSKVGQEGNCFYSSRKFLGVCDGAYAYSSGELSSDLAQDRDSYLRMSHLLRRIESGAQSGYGEYQKVESELDQVELLGMSNLTSSILRSIDYDSVKAIRKRNFEVLHKALAGMNEFHFKDLSESVPLCYPFLTTNGEVLRNRLIKKRIYVATYWTDVLRRESVSGFEKYMTSNLLALPIDQRYTVNEMSEILNVIIQRSENV